MNKVRIVSIHKHFQIIALLLGLVLLPAMLSPVAAAGTTNNALNFDGIDDHIVVSNPESFNVGSSTDFTIEAVIKTTRTNAAIFSKMGKSNVVGYQFWVFNGRLLLEWSFSQNIISQVQVNDGQCHHVAVVVDRSAQNAKLYVDGILQADVTHSRYGNNIDNTNPVYIGQERTLNSGFRFQGEMDEVAFFTTARTAAEIQASSTTQLTGTESGLLAYWKFNAGTPSGANAGVTTLTDESGNGNDGVLQNFALNGNYSNWVASNCAQEAPNQPPTADAGGPYSGDDSGDEGAAIAMSGASASDPDGDALTYSWTVDSALCSFDDATALNPNLTCTDNGSFTATLEVSDGSETDSSDVAVTVDNVAPTIAISGASNVNEGSSYSLTLGAVTDPGADTVSAYVVHWGDGNSDNLLTHTYVDGLNTYNITVDLTDEDGTFTNAANALSVTVDNVAPTLGAISVDVALVPVNTAINASAEFTDPGTLDTHTAAWDWGDGTSAGTVTEVSGSGSVNDSHSYSAPGIYTIKLTVTDDDLADSNESTYEVIVYAFAPGGGAFVVGDQTASGSVTFWGSKWAKMNVLSGGSAPSAFKGFAHTPSAPACGDNWSTDPGNSAPPPEGPLPSYMAVIVTSSSVKSGSTITGDTVSMVVVQTDPGYDSNPGHPGTGTVVATICP